MKPIWAHRETRCHFCHDAIEPKSRRLDDMVRRGAQILRLHYHVECYIEMVKQWFEANPYVAKSGAGGRPLLDLSEEDKKQRRQVLNNLSALKQYYLPRLNFSADISDMEINDLKKFKRFHQRRKELLEKLEKLGGLPEQYQGTSTPKLLDMAPKTFTVASQPVTITT
jgi:hypothetical protein